MNPSIEHAIEQAEIRKSELEESVAALREIDACCELPASVHAYPSAVGGVSLHVPYDPATVKALRRALGANFKRLSSWRDIGGDVFWTGKWRLMTGVAVPVTICILPAMEGATCQRVQVGERMEPVYKVVCGGAP